jgi:hypothetical protein
MTSICCSPPLKVPGQQLLFFLQNREQAEHLFQGILPLFPDPRQICPHLQVFANRHFPKGPAALGNVETPNSTMEKNLRPSILWPRNSTLPEAGPQQAGYGIERRGFPGAVGADQCDNFSLVDLQGHVIQGLDLAVKGADILYLQHWLNLPRYTLITVFALLAICSGVPSAIFCP